jgi:hypothetical protein
MSSSRTTGQGLSTSKITSDAENREFAPWNCSFRGAIFIPDKFTSDILFKMLFTRNEELLRSLVAAALGIAPADIKTLNVKNPEILPEELGSKFCRLDLNMVVNDEPKKMYWR